MLEQINGISNFIVYNVLMTKERRATIQLSKLWLPKGLYNGEGQWKIVNWIKLDNSMVKKPAKKWFILGKILRIMNIKDPSNKFLAQHKLKSLNCYILFSVFVFIFPSFISLLNLWYMYKQFFDLILQLESKSPPPAQK